MAENHSPPRMVYKLRAFRLFGILHSNDPRYILPRSAFNWRFEDAPDGAAVQRLAVARAATARPRYRRTSSKAVRRFARSLLSTRDREKRRRIKPRKDRGRTRGRG